MKRTSASVGMPARISSSSSSSSAEEAQGAPAPENPAPAGEHAQAAADALATVRDLLGELRRRRVDHAGQPFGLKATMALNQALEACDRAEECVKRLQAAPGHEADQAANLQRECEHMRSELLELHMEDIGSDPKAPPGAKVAAAVRLAAARKDFMGARAQLHELGAIPNADSGLYWEAALNLWEAQYLALGGEMAHPTGMNTPAWLEYILTLADIGSSEALEAAARHLKSMVNASPEGATGELSDVARKVATGWLQLGTFQPVLDLMSSPALPLDVQDCFASAQCRNRLESLAVAAAAQEARRSGLLLGDLPIPEAQAPAAFLAASVVVQEWNEVLPRVAGLLAQREGGPDAMRAEWRGLLAELKPQFGQQQLLELALALDAAQLDALAAETREIALPGSATYEGPPQQDAVVALFVHLGASDFRQASVALRSLLAHPLCNDRERSFYRQTFMCQLSLREERASGDPAEVEEALMERLLATVEFGDDFEARQALDTVNLATLPPQAAQKLNELARKMSAALGARLRPDAASHPNAILQELGMQQLILLQDVERELSTLARLVHSGATELIVSRIAPVVSSVMRAVDTPAARRDPALRGRLHGALNALLNFLMGAPVDLFKALCAVEADGTSSSRFWRCLTEFAWIARAMSRNPSLPGTVRDFLIIATSAASNPLQLDQLERLVTGRIAGALKMFADNVDSATMQAGFMDFVETFPHRAFERHHTMLEAIWTPGHHPERDAAAFIADGILGNTLHCRTAPDWWTDELMTLLRAGLQKIGHAAPEEAATAERWVFGRAVEALATMDTPSSMAQISAVLAFATELAGNNLTRQAAITEALANNPARNLVRL